MNVNLSLLLILFILNIKFCTSNIDEKLDGAENSMKLDFHHRKLKRHGSNPKQHHGFASQHEGKAKYGKDYFHHHESHISLYDWNSFQPANQKDKEDMQPLGDGRPVSELNLHQPVYVSMTTTSARIRTVANSIMDVFKGSIIPTHVFLFVSNTEYLGDKGVEKGILPLALQELAANQPFTIVFTKNIGPHRRLLPLLSKFWHTDCIIIALDDDRPSEFTHTAVEKLLSYYIHSGKSAIVALKVLLHIFFNNFNIKFI